MGSISFQDNMYDIEIFNNTQMIVIEENPDTTPVNNTAGNIHYILCPYIYIYIYIYGHIYIYVYR